jgi:hypothetical protein
MHDCMPCQRQLPISLHLTSSRMTPPSPHSAPRIGYPRRNIMFNQISATLPPQWGGMKAVQEMYLSVNRFTGGIPASWAQMTALQTL